MHVTEIWSENLKGGDFFLPLAPLRGPSLPYCSTGLIVQFFDHSQAVGLLGRVVGSLQGLYLNTEKRGHILSIHAQGGVRTHKSGVIPLGYRDRRREETTWKKMKLLRG
jgi:hypothetical protein